MRVRDFQGVKVYRSPAPDKRMNKDGSPKEPRRLGKIHFPVFEPRGRRVVGFMVSLPDVAGMIKQPDRFVARDALHIYEGALSVVDEKANFDKAAAKRLGIDLDACVIWTGMDVRTESGEALGYCSDAVFDFKTGAVETLSLTRGATASALLGDVEMPVEMLKGYAQGAMVVSDAAATLDVSGGAAAKAAEVSVKVGAKVKQGAQVLDDKGSVAVEKGSRALGRQLGKTRGMFSAFKSEFKKAAGPAPKKKKKR